VQAKGTAGIMASDETARLAALRRYINQLMDEVRFADGGRELHMRKVHKAVAQHECQGRVGRFRPEL
jgi:hypothetical protein